MTSDAAVVALRAAVVTWRDTLEGDQRARATFSFLDDQRFVWQYTPGEREGLPLAAMTLEQRAAASAILRTAMSVRGADEAAAIIALEPVLAELERQDDDPMWRRRDPERYWFALFGEPDAAAASPWSWRVGGHHLLVQSTIVDGVVAFTPSFLGANPAVVPRGPQAGGRAIRGEEDLARALLGSLSADQRAVAVVDPLAPPDIRSGNGRRPSLARIPAGILRADLTVPQQGHLDALVRHYVGRARDEVADAAWTHIVEAGLDDLAFAWAGPDEPGRGHYYAIRGPRTLIEYDNTQDGANHIHSVWRDLVDDWGEDALVDHYRRSHR
jgi:hypothetical protein